MNFDSPIPFDQALKIVRDKIATGTDLSSQEIAASWTKEARALSLFSARTTCAEYLDEARQPLLDFIAGKINEAQCRQRMQAELEKFGYTPEGGFPDQPNAVPPATAGSLRDLSSDRRVKLVIETISRLAANTAFMTAGQDPDALYDYPCWELVRVYLREHPRGESESPIDLGWPERWARAGGELAGPDNRMIARKDDEIWQNLGDSGIFPDGTDSDAPPYAFNSGYGIVEVPRSECADLGIDLTDISPGRPSLLGDLFDGHPERATLADLKSSRNDILEALKEMEQAA